MTRLDLIQFESLGGRPNTSFGLQEVGENGELVNLFNHEADQLNRPIATWSFVRTLGEMEDSDDFWNLLEGISEITPTES